MNQKDYKDKLQCPHCKKWFGKHLINPSYELIKDCDICDKCDELSHKTITEDNPNGRFYCPKCDIKTNHKTPKTTCVECDSTLQRSS
tara:strand:- start:34 stop:294 length:261 start_codon:yes stop_codon:yes gene_type:complete